MTIVPVITLAAVVCLALAFEAAYAFISSRMSLAIEQWQWTAVFWLAICVVGFTSGVIPSRPAFSSDWIGFFLGAWVHVCMNMFCPSVLAFRRRRSDEDRSDSGRTPREPPGGISRQTDLQESRDEAHPEGDEQ